MNELPNEELHSIGYNVDVVYHFRIHNIHTFSYVTLGSREKAAITSAGRKQIHCLKFYINNKYISRPEY